MSNEKIAETARQERSQGGQPSIHSSGDPTTNSAVPNGKSELTSDAAQRIGSSQSREAIDDDMAPGG